MTSEKKDQEETDSQVDSNDNPDKAKNPKSLMLFNLGLLITIAAVAGFNFKSIKDIKDDTSVTRSVSGLSSNMEEVSEELGALRSRIQQYEAEMSSLSAAVDESNESLEILYSSQDDQDRTLPVTEAEHLISIANIKLRLEGNIKAAIVALEEANDRLMEVGDPGLFSLRRQITADINTLKSYPHTDIVGMSFALSDLASRVNQFSLKSTALTGETISIDQTNPQDPAWKRLMLGVWQEFKSMFIITRTGEDMSTSLLPNERFFLYQNLRLQLESARLAVLRKDTALMQDSLNIAHTWLQEYFDPEDAAVNNAIVVIDSMKTVELERPVPDISGSGEALSGYLNDNQTPNVTDGVIEQP